jgi:hypothetical protein
MVQLAVPLPQGAARFSPLHVIMIRHPVVLALLQDFEQQDPLAARMHRQRWDVQTLEKRIHLHLDRLIRQKGFEHIGAAAAGHSHHTVSGRPAQLSKRLDIPRHHIPLCFTQCRVIHRVFTLFVPKKSSVEILGGIVVLLCPQNGAR